MARRITLADIAARVGVTKATVSLALRGNARISRSTRARVEEAAKELGYRPDPALASIAQSRWSNCLGGSGSALACLVDSREGNMRYQRRCLRSAQMRASEHGYVLHEFNLAEYPAIEKAGKVLRARGIRGLLVPQLHLSGPQICQIGVEDFVIVCLDRGWFQMPFHSVLMDNFKATRIVWNEAVKRGYTRIAGALLQHDPPALDDATRIAASCVSQMEWIPADQRLPLLTSGLFDKDSFLLWMERYRPDAIIGMTVNQFHWLQEAGWRIPEEVGFAALLGPENVQAGISGTPLMTGEIGAASVDVLVSVMRHNELGIPSVRRKTMLEPIWNEGVTMPWQDGIVPSVSRQEVFGGCLGATRHLIFD